MIEHLIYFVMQSLGYRLYYYDLALARGIPLSGYSSWLFRPGHKKGTYRECFDNYKHVGCGVDK